MVEQWLPCDYSAHGRCGGTTPSKIGGERMRRIHSTRSLLRAATAAVPYAALALLAGAPGASRAQEQTHSTETTGGPLQEITVTATRREEILSRVPISVTALTQESLDNRGIKDFAEVARFT